MKKIQTLGLNKQMTLMTYISMATMMFFAHLKVFVL